MIYWIQKDVSTSYSKVDIDVLLDGKANTNNTYTTTQVSDLLIIKANILNPTFFGTVSGITKSMVGLGNVDNVSDVNKAISNATQTALNLKANLTYVDTAFC
jgi:hypothetical protein